MFNEIRGNYLLASLYLVTFEVIVHLYFQYMNIKISTACKNTKCAFEEFLYPVTIRHSHLSWIEFSQRPIRYSQSGIRKSVDRRCAYSTNILAYQRLDLEGTTVDSVCTPFEY
jgi:hypothetical protein